MKTEKNEPNWATIKSKLDAYKRFAEAYSRGLHPLPPLPVGIRGPSNIVVLVWGGAIHMGLMLIGRLASKLSLHGLRIWVARKRISLDRLLETPGSYGLNRAFTELGLALLKIGNIDEARDCLAQAWRVHPCVKSTFMFGLDSRLWLALRKTGSCDDVCAEYEQVANRYYLLADWPPRKVYIPLRARIRAIVDVFFRGKTRRRS